MYSIRLLSQIGGGMLEDSSLCGLDRYVWLGDGVIAIARGSIVVDSVVCCFHLKPSSPASPDTPSRSRSPQQPPSKLAWPSRHTGS